MSQFTVQAGCISAVAVVVLLWIVGFKYKNRIRDSASSRKLVRTNIDGLMLNLLIADLLTSIGAILDVRWAHTARVSCNTHCDVQGAIQLVGETAVALFTLAITVLTFMTILRGRPIKRWWWAVVAAVVWAFVLLWAVIGGVTNKEFYAPTPYWCWVSPRYKLQRLFGEYIWLWVAGFGSILLYCPLFLVLRGNISWEPESGWRSIRWRWRRSEKDGVSVTSRGESGPFTLLWYPVAYTILVLPVSIVRWMSPNQRVPSAEMSTATFVTVSVFNLSGVVNVLLILFTRTNVLGLGSSPTLSPSLESAQVDAGPLPETGQDHWETGFGGPRVILRDGDSEFESGRINRVAEGSALGLTGMNIPKSPGRAYLESIGITRDSRS